MVAVLLAGGQRIRPNRQKLRSQSVNADAMLTHADDSPSPECRKSSFAQRLCGRSRIMLAAHAEKVHAEYPSISSFRKGAIIGECWRSLAAVWDGVVSQATRAR